MKKYHSPDIVGQKHGILVCAMWLLCKDVEQQIW